MIERLEKFIFKHLPNNALQKTDEGEEKIKIATVALFLEMAYADFEVDPAEEDQIISAVQDFLK